MTLLVDNSDGSAPPTAENSPKRWLLDLGSMGIDLSRVTVLADPNYSMVAGGGSFSTPMVTVVDPRTMQVTHSHEGYKAGPMTETEEVAKKNKLVQ